MDLRGFEGFQTKKDYSKQQREFIHKQKRIGSVAVSSVVLIMLLIMYCSTSRSLELQLLLQIQLRYDYEEKNWN